MIHPTAIVEDGAKVGPNTRVWHYAHIRSGASIGANCNIGDTVYIDTNVLIGDGVKLQNRVSIYRGVTLETGVFVGPNVTFSNDNFPRAIMPDGRPVEEGDWELLPTLVKYGASIGGGAVVLPGLTIGCWAMIGANTLVTRSVPDHGLVYGQPGRLQGYACRCGRRLDANGGSWRCPACGSTYDLPALSE